MTDSTAAFKASFSHPILTPILGQPTHSSLLLLQQELNANATSIHLDSRDGVHGHLVLTEAPAIFTAMPGHVPFPPPVNPGAVPIHAANATAAQIAANERVHAEQLRTYRLYHAVDSALKALLLQAVDDIYTQSLADPRLRYSTVTCLQVITHLWTAYGTIPQQELDLNLARMSAPWHPLEALWAQLDLGRAFADAAGEPIPPSQIIRIGYNLIFKTGLFPDACREWRQRILPPQPAPTFQQFQSHFRQANEDHCLLATTESAGYHANAILSPATNPSPAPLSFDTQSAIVTAVAAAMANHLQSLPATVATRPPRQKSYCWTHGFILNESHNSMTCRKQAPGHQTAATQANKMGGATSHQRRRQDAAAPPIPE
jgi:hypothetical protein